jgi:hypothetical protein
MAATNEKKSLTIRRGVAERIVSSVTPPRAEPLSSTELWVDGKPDTDVLREHLFHEGRLHLEDVERIMNTANAIFREEPNVLTIEAPIASLFPSLNVSVNNKLIVFSPSLW